MSSNGASAEQRGAFSFTKRFSAILGCFALLLCASLPVLLSFDLWIMGDRSSHLNLDYLFFQEHYLLGVTACYSYGLLPVLVHHVVFLLFGRDYKPMLGCIVAADVLFAVVWTLLSKHLPRGRWWLAAILLLVPILLEVNPNLAYSFVILSMLLAFWFVLERKLPTALAVSLVGCFGVPSLPIVLSLLLAACIVVEWWMEVGHRPVVLLRRFLPGAVTYAALFAGMSLIFGYRAMLATALPTNGVKFYKASGWYGFSRSLVFFAPPDGSLKYYLGYYTITPVTWFTFSLVLLAVVSLRSLPGLIVERRFHPARLCMLLSLIVILVFLLVAFGGKSQQLIYQPVLAIGTLLAMASLPPRIRNASLIIFILLGTAGELWQASKTVVAWRKTRPAPLSFGLYVDPQFDKELAGVIDMSQGRKLFLFSYATGQHLYYPTLESPDMWFLQPGLMFPSDRKRILNQIDNADIVAIDNTRFHFFQDYDPDVRPRLAAMCLVSVTDNFRIFRRPGLEPGPCMLNGVAPG